MAQVVQFRSFTKEDFATDEGVAKLNLFLQDLVSQVQAMQGTVGTIKLDNNIDLQGKFKVINQAP